MNVLKHTYNFTVENSNELTQEELINEIEKQMMKYILNNDSDKNELFDVNDLFDGCSVFSLSE